MLFIQNQAYNQHLQAFVSTVVFPRIYSHSFLIIELRAFHSIKI